MKINKFLLTFILLSVFSLTALAQEKQDEKTPAQWDRIESANGEFSIEMPANPGYFYDKEGFRLSYPDKGYDFPRMQVLNASAENTVMTVEIYEVSSPKGCLKALMGIDRIEGAKTSSSPDGFNIQQVEQTEFRLPRTDGPMEIYRSTKYISSKTHLYVITTANRGKKTAAAERFLSSIRLNKEKPKNDSGEKIVSISALEPVTIEQIVSDASGRKQDVLPPRPAPNTVKNPTPIVFLTKPLPTYTNSARNARYSGNVIMRMTMTKDGNIAKVLILSALPEDLSRNSFFAAMRVKFLPEEKDGKLVTIDKTVEYGFTIF